VTPRIWPTLPKNHGHDMSHLNFLSFTIQFGKKIYITPNPNLWNGIYNPLLKPIKLPP
jgi:hypothetical protein